MWKSVFLICAVTALVQIAFVKSAPVETGIAPAWIDGFVNDYKETRLRLHETMRNLMVRPKRQAGSSPTTVKSVMTTPPTTYSPNTEFEDVDDSPGPSNTANSFFDRAAQFVMEVLQRFLKWVNNE